MNHCDHQTILQILSSAKDHCALITEACNSQQLVVNFFKVHFCYTRTWWVTAPLFLLILVLIFRFICELVEEFIVPALLNIATYFQMSEALAGVTLLALANGLGDISTAFVASTHTEGISYIIGSIYGAGLFTFTVVVLWARIATKGPIELQRGALLRDVGTYLFATGLLVFFGREGKVSPGRAMSFFAVYAGFVAIVAAQEWRSKAKAREAGEEAVPILGGDAEGGERRTSEAHNVDFIAELLGRSSTRGVFESFARGLSRRREVPRFEESGRFAKVLRWAVRFELPLAWLRRLTILPPGQGKVDRWRVVVWPFLGIPVILFALFGQPRMVWLWTLPLALGLSIVFWQVLEKDRVSSARLGFFFAFFCAFSAILWTKIVSGLLIDLICFFGTVLNISSSYLGFTVIAIGNALPDSLITVAIARRGQAVMALTGAYAGQVFGLLFGIGLSFLKRSHHMGGSFEFDLFKAPRSRENDLILLLVSFTVFSLAVTLLWLPLRGFRVEKSFGFSMGAIYAAFIAISTFIVQKSMFGS